MKNLNELNKEELLDLLFKYDKYIQYNVDNNEGLGHDWFPVCINEFYYNDYQVEDE